MTKETKDRSHLDNGELAAHRLRLPGFISDEDLGLGDVIKRTSSYFGIKPCGGCENRTDAFNRWLVFTNRQSK